MTIYFSATKSNIKPIEVSSAEALEKNLMQILLSAQLPVASSCKGDGICSKCKVQVLEGQENLNSESALESKTKLKNKVAPNERLACQLYLAGDITVDTPYW